MPCIEIPLHWVVFASLYSSFAIALLELLVGCNSISLFSSILFLASLSLKLLIISLTTSSISYSNIILPGGFCTSIEKYVSAFALPLSCSVFNENFLNSSFFLLFQKAIFFILILFIHFIIQFLFFLSIWFDFNSFQLISLYSMLHALWSIIMFSIQMSTQTNCRIENWKLKTFNVQFKLKRKLFLMIKQIS